MWPSPGGTPVLILSFQITLLLRSPVLAFPLELWCRLTLPLPAPSHSPWVPWASMLSWVLTFLLALPSSPQIFPFSLELQLGSFLLSFLWCFSLISFSIFWLDTDLGLFPSVWILLCALLASLFSSYIIISDLLASPSLQLFHISYFLIFPLLPSLFPNFSAPSPGVQKTLPNFYPDSSHYPRLLASYLLSR